MREFRVAFARLNPEQREVLTLIGVIGFSYEEAATILTLAVGIVKRRVSQARAALADLMNLRIGQSPVAASPQAIISAKAQAPAHAM